MSEDLTERAEKIFCSALKITSPADRNDLLDRECDGDGELRSRVEKLLAAQGRVNRFFGSFQDGVAARLPMAELSKAIEETSGTVEEVPKTELEDGFVGSTVGDYKLLQKIGEGGCGAVYMAEQEKPVRRRVALKIIKLGMDTKNVIARFEAERQALAMMDHPNIARVFDGGATESGRPYFVMELVRGVKITEYCDQNELDTEERLKLFIQVCHAIQHAHQKGVIHRDIKPSNILVTIIDGQPVPKVIDFGIAKAIEGRLTDNTIFTAYEQFIGTPAYMSPEQAVMSGVDVDTRSDIYSLGVLLYELLTGRTPFEANELLKGGIDGLRRTLQEREPQRPSVMVTTMQGAALTRVAAHRHAEPVKLISQLRGDLDWIVIRTLEKDRSRRYQTANGLALDVQRYLDNEPILARPPSRYYRLQKLVRRNKTKFIAGTMVALALIVGLGVATWFWHQEKQARQRAVAAEQEKSRLLREAQDGERIAEAKFLLVRGKIEQADALVAGVSVVKPSMETESVLRDLGNWHASNGEWAQAAARFNLLLEADLKDNSLEMTGDLLLAGPIQIELGDVEGYERFRRAAVARFLDTTDPIAAERTLKISLLLPPDAADADLMKSLQKLSEVAANSIRGIKAAAENMVAWRCVSLGLMAYRQDDAAAARDWCRKCLAFSGDVPHNREATAHIIQAMACYKLGETDEALAELTLGKNLVAANTPRKFDEARNTLIWSDWLFARILLREAEALVK
jgi:eukaryotic-like serine/threonine-protein kinase